MRDEVRGPGGFSGALEAGEAEDQGFGVSGTGEEGVYGGEEMG